MQVFKPSPIQLQHFIRQNENGEFVVELEAKLAGFMEQNHWYLIEEPQIPKLWQQSASVNSSINLPPLVIRCFVLKQQKFWHEIAMSLRSSTVFISHAVVLLCYQAEIIVENIFGTPITHYFLVIDDIQNLQSKRYFYRCFKLRQGDDRAVHLLDDTPLMPSWISIKCPTLNCSPVYENHWQKYLTARFTRMAKRHKIDVDFSVPKSKTITVQATTPEKTIALFRREMVQQRMSAKRKLRQTRQLHQRKVMLRHVLSTRQTCVDAAGQFLAVLENALVIEQNFSDMHCQGNRFENVTFKVCDFTGVVFTNATFIKTHFVDCVLLRTQWHHVSFEKCQFTRVDFKGSSFEKVRINDNEWRDCDGRLSRWQDSTFSNWHARNLLLAHTSWQETLFKQVTMRQLGLQGAMFKKVQFYQGKFCDVNAYCLEATKTGWHHFYMLKVIASEAHFAACGWMGQSTLSTIDFSYAILKDCHFFQLRLYKVEFEGSVMTGSSFREVMIVRSGLYRVKAENSRYVKVCFITSKVLMNYWPNSYWLGVRLKRTKFADNYQFQSMVEYCDDEITG